ncbi:MAG: peptide-methionine (S)-S-oxide reductase MsrA [Leptospiraceae bacterium]|nr:peptide-methionine (S)-S-oxide reductase MsrA [Leptospiraceae bacterium]
MKASESGYETAIFAGGCFWCVESDLEKLDGVISVISGYTGGDVENPTYEEVSDGGTGHREAVMVTFDPQKISYETLLQAFWHNVDPVDARGQFCDKGFQYTSAIFYGSPEQKAAADDSKMLLEADEQRFGGQTIATEILPAKTFYPAEDYHQDYYKKNPIRYKFYRGRCGRDNRLKEVWGK